MPSDQRTYVGALKAGDRDHACRSQVLNRLITNNINKTTAGVAKLTGVLAVDGASRIHAAIPGWAGATCSSQDGRCSG